MSYFHLEKTKTSVLRPMYLEFTWIHQIAPLVIFSASMKENEHIGHTGIENNAICARTSKFYSCSCLNGIFFYSGYIGL